VPGARALVAALLVLALAAPAAAQPAAPTVVTFGCTGAEQTWTVPAGVT
jgi:hypothetical protein